MAQEDASADRWYDIGPEFEIHSGGVRRDQELHTLLVPGSAGVSEGPRGRTRLDLGDVSPSIKPLTASA